MKFTSPVYSAASGSIAGITYSHNAGGNYTRARATPINSNTTRQQAARAAMAAAGGQWSAFNDAQRQLWEDYAQATSWVDSLGNSVRVFGFSAFCRWATLRHRAGESLAVAPPAGTSGYGEPPIAIAIEATTPEATITIEPAASIGGEVFLQLSAALAPSQKSLRRPVFLDSFGVVNPVATSATTAVVAPVASTERRVARAVIAYDDGRVSADFAEIVTVTAS